MAKRKFIRLLSFWLSVVMLMFSLPTAASDTEETTMEELTTEKVTEAVLEETTEDTEGTVTKHYEWRADGDDSGLSTASALDDEEGGGYVREYYSYLINSEVVPDGVYSLRNWDAEYSYLDVAQGSASAGAYLQQKVYYTGPAIDFVRRSLFKITRYEGTDYYVIRLMTNNDLSIEDSGDQQYRLKTHEIAVYDENVSLADTFSITRSDDYGYIIRPYGSSLAIGSSTLAASETNTQYVTLQNPSSSNGDAITWELEKYADGDQAGVDIDGPATLTVNNFALFTISSSWSTKPDAEHAQLYIDASYSSVATGTWVENLRTLTVRPRDNETFPITVQFTNILDVVQIVYNVEYYTPGLALAEGTYFFANLSWGLCMQVYDPSTTDYSSSGASLKLFSFDSNTPQRFTLEHEIDGYYKIITSCGKVVSVRGGYPDEAGYLWQAFYLGSDTQLWRFTKTNIGSYVIRPKSGTAYETDWCMGVEWSLPGEEGYDVEQRAYTSDTNREDEWVLITPDAYSFIFCGIPSTGDAAKDNNDNSGGNEGHDHSSALKESRNSLLDSGYTNIQLFETELTAGTYKSYLNTANVIATRSHGGLITSSSTGAVVGSTILLTDDAGSTVSKFCSSEIGSAIDFEYIEQQDSFTNVKLVVFIGCNTGIGGENASNLVSEMEAHDATTAIGFNGTIDCGDANTWTKAFFASLAAGNTVQQACDTASESMPETSPLKNAVICGDRSYVLGN